MKDNKRNVMVENEDIAITLSINNEEVTHLECREVFEDVLRGAGFTLQYNPGED
jgi:hypothetical protein